MQTSQEGIDLIKKFEDCILSAYRNPVGILTIGYGHTAGVKPGDVIDAKKAEDLLRFDLKTFENHVKYNVYIPLNQNQFDALVSFAYNSGLKNLKTLTKNRNTAQIANEILLYNKANGKILPGLVNRRKAEQELFLKPIKAN